MSGADKEDGLEISDNEGGSVMTSGVWNQFLRPPSPASTAELEGMVVVVVVVVVVEEEEEEFEEWVCMSASGVKCMGISGVRPSPERKKFNKWSTYWRYFNLDDLPIFLNNFSHSELNTTGFFATFFRFSLLRVFFSYFDLAFEKLLPKKSRYIVFGAAIK